HHGRQRPVVLHPARPGHRFPRPERRREDHHHADDPGPAEWTKLCSVRSTFWALTVTVVLGIALGAVISVATAHGYAKFSVSQKLSWDPTGGQRGGGGHRLAGHRRARGADP